MSSTPQGHSIQHQCEKLTEYALAHGIEIVKMYADAGRRGLRINGRNGLQTMLADVQTGQPGFDLILVYDVSRWGASTISTRARITSSSAAKPEFRSCFKKDRSGPNHRTPIKNFFHLSVGGKWAGNSRMSIVIMFLRVVVFRYWARSRPCDLRVSLVAIDHIPVTI